MQTLVSKLVTKLYGFFFNIMVFFSPERTAQTAFQVFSKVRKGRVRPDQRPFLDTAKKTMLEVAGHGLQVYEWPGAKETVLLVHGWESNAWRWHRLIGKLRDAHYHIIAFDAPAHGNSNGTHLHIPGYATAIQALIERYRPQYLVGHSMGGMAILYNEHLRPNEVVTAIVAIGAPAEFKETMAHYQKLLGFNHKVLNALDTYVQQRFGMAIRECSSVDFVSANTKKGLLVHDRWDPITPYHGSVKVHEAWEGSELMSTEGLGHSMHQDEVNDRIVDFLNRVGS
ncbi:alpha/beta fold hydrolase [Maribacter sp. 2307ULW6-5]|uniref:alpha/beta fold hydrolase n=1 Tax=Maribacter sp. 2307ULW6-5 TaxID=3386275 RepID=UPI0039BC88C3